MAENVGTGDLIRVMEHNLDGYAWTIGMVGAIQSPAYEADFDLLKESATPRPAVRSGWWIVNVEHRRARGGFATATLPEEVLAPHGCTTRCGTHVLS